MQELAPFLSGYCEENKKVEFKIFGIHLKIVETKNNHKFLQYMRLKATISIALRKKGNISDKLRNAINSCLENDNFCYEDFI